MGITAWASLQEETYPPELSYSMTIDMRQGLRLSGRTSELIDRIGHVMPLVASLAMQNFHVTGTAAIGLSHDGMKISLLSAPILWFIDLAVAK